MKSLLHRKLLMDYLGHLSLGVFGLLYMYPFLWMIGSSLKARSEFFNQGLAIFPEYPRWINYTEAWQSTNFGVYFTNTILISVVATAFVVILTSMAGYSLARNNFPGKRIVIGCMLATMFLPRGYIIIPIFEIIKWLKLLNTLWAVILINTATGMVFNTFLFLGYFTTFPREIEDSAIIDGASYPALYWHIAIPFALPMLGTVILFEFLDNWNSFFIPLVFTLSRPDLRTIAVGMYSLVGETATDWTLLCAAATMSLLPTMILFILLQHTFVNGIAGAIKG